MLSRRRIITSFLACSALPVVPWQSAAYGQVLREKMRQRMAKRMRAAPADGAVEYRYGADPLQKLDFWRPDRADGPVPLIVFVHGGGWRMGDKGSATGATKVEHLVGQGYAMASIDYRLVPAATVEQQAGDVATAIAWLKTDAAKLGVDRARIILMGHSAGAHLVALVGTDRRYLQAVGLDVHDLRGVIALDGACYDVPRQIAAGGSFMHDTYVQAFGGDLGRQRALSPTLHAAAPNAPAFLILHVDRAYGKAQSEALATALQAAGTAVEMHGFDGKGLRGHMAINRELGRPDYPATPVVDAWIRRVRAAG